MKNDKFLELIPLEIQAKADRLQQFQELYTSKDVVSSEDDYDKYPGQFVVERIIKGKNTLFRMESTEPQKEKKTIIVSDWSLYSYKDAWKEIIWALLVAGFDVRYWNGQEAIIFAPKEIEKCLNSIRAGTQEEIERAVAQDKNRTTRKRGEALYHLDYFTSKELFLQFGDRNLLPFSRYIVKADTLYLLDLALFKEIPKEIEDWLMSYQGEIAVHYDQKETQDSKHLQYLISHEDISQKITRCSFGQIKDVSLFNQITQLKNLKTLSWFESEDSQQNSGKDLILGDNPKISWPSLQTLTLYRSTITHEDLAKILENCPKLENINIRDCFNLIERKPDSKKSQYPLDKLKRLTLSNVMIDLANFLRGKMACLETVELYEVSLVGTSQTEEIRLATHFPNLKNIRFSKVIQGAEWLLQFVKKAPLLETLHIQSFIALERFLLPNKAHSSSFRNLRDLTIKGNFPLQPIRVMLSRASRLKVFTLSGNEEAINFMPEFIPDLGFPELEELTFTKYPFYHDAKPEKQFVPIGTYLKLLSSTKKVTSFEFKSNDLNQAFHRQSLLELDTVNLDHISSVALVKCQTNGEIVKQLLFLAKNTQSLLFSECDSLETLMPQDIPDGVMFDQLKKINVKNSTIRGDTLAKLIAHSPNLESIEGSVKFNTFDLSQYQTNETEIRLEKLHNLEWLSFLGSFIPLKEFLFILSRSCVKQIDFRYIDLTEDISLEEELPLFTFVEKIIITNKADMGRTLKRLLPLLPNLKEIASYERWSWHSDVSENTLVIEAEDIPNHLRLPALHHLSLSGMNIHGIAVAKLINSSEIINYIDLSRCHYLDDLAHHLIDTHLLSQLTKFDHENSNLPLATLIKFATSFPSNSKSVVSREKLFWSRDLIQSGRRQIVIPPDVQFPNILEIKCQLISLEKEYIETSCEAFMSLLNATPNLKKIEFDNVGYLKAAPTLALKHSELPLEIIRIKDSTLSKKIWQSLMAISPNLREFYYTGSSNWLQNHDSCNNEEKDKAPYQLPKSLEIIEVDSRVVSDDFLQALIHQSAGLKQLKLLGVIIDPRLQPSITYSALQVVKISNSVIPTNWYWALLSGAAEIRELELYNNSTNDVIQSTRRQQQEFKIPNLDALTSISIDQSSFSDVLLKAILQKAKNLTKLYLDDKGLRKLFNLIETPLTELTELTIINRKFTTDFVLQLPYLLPNLKQLTLKKCLDLNISPEDLEDKPYYFSQLDKLVIEDSNINGPCAQFFITHGSKLTDIVFRNCINLKTLEINPSKGGLSNLLKRFVISSSVRKNVLTHISSGTVDWLLTQSALTILSLTGCFIESPTKLISKEAQAIENNLVDICLEDSRLDQVLLDSMIAGTADLLTLNLHYTNVICSDEQPMKCIYNFPSNALNRKRNNNIFNFDHSNLPVSIVLALHRAFNLTNIDFNEYSYMSESSNQKLLANPFCQVASATEVNIRQSTFNASTFLFLLSNTVNIQNLSCEFVRFDQDEPKKRRFFSKEKEDDVSLNLNHLEHVTIGAAYPNYNTSFIEMPILLLHKIIAASPNLKSIKLNNIKFENTPLPSASLPSLQTFASLILNNANLPTDYCELLLTHAKNLKIEVHEDKNKHRENFSSYPNKPFPISGLSHKDRSALSDFFGAENPSAYKDSGHFDHNSNHFSSDEFKQNTTKSKAKQKQDSQPLSRLWNRILGPSQSEKTPRKKDPIETHLPKKIESAEAFSDFNVSNNSKLISFARNCGAEKTLPKTKARILFQPAGHPRNYRLQPFDTITFGDDDSIQLSLTKVGILDNPSLPVLNNNGILIAKNSKQILSSFQAKSKTKKGKKYTLCSHEMAITEEWAPLPASKKHQQILEFHTDFAFPYEIKYLKEYQFYFIRAVGKGKEKQAGKISRVSFILQQVPQTARIYFSPAVNELINYCARFEEKPFNFPSGATCEQILDLRYRHQIGTCRERAIVFLTKVKPHLDQDNFVTLLTKNDVHMAPEIGNGNLLMSIELGGTPAEIELLENPEFTAKNEPTAEVTPALKKEKASPIKPAITEQSLNPAFCTWKTRQDPLPIESVCADLSMRGANIRLLLDRLDDDAFVILTFAKYSNKPFLFIDTADELQWHAADLKFKQNRLKMKDNFSRIRHFIDTNPEGGTIFLNFNRFSPQEIVALHCVLKERLLEGERIPPQFTMVSLHSTSIPGVYQGEDFITRHNKVLKWSADYHQGIDLFDNRLVENNELSTNHCIDLFNSSDWEAILFRQIQIINKQLSIRPSAFLEELNNNDLPLSALHLINPPSHLREFQLFWQQAMHRNHFILYGRRFNLSEHFQLFYSSKLVLPIEVIKANNEEKSETPYPLNFKTFTEMFDDFLYADNSMASCLGLLEQHQGGSISLLVTADLPLAYWSRLLTTAQQLEVTIHLSHLADIRLPAELAEAPTSEYKANISELTKEILDESFYQHPYSIIVAPLSEQAQSPFTELLLNRYSDAVYVAIDTCHDFGDLFYQIDAKLTRQGIEASFKEGAIWRALQDGETVIVEGRLSKPLIQALTPLMISDKPEFRINGEAVHFTGKLFIVTDSSIPAACNQYTLSDLSLVNLPVNNQQSGEIPSSDEKSLHNQTDDLSAEASEQYLAQMFSRIQAGFNKSHIVALVGSTGIGKTTYLTEEFENEYFYRTRRKAKLYFDFELFAKHRDPDVDPFYCHDEANLSSMPLALFKSLNCVAPRKPHLLNNGDYFPFSGHRVFLLFNPAKDGGARKQDNEFSFAEIIQFDRPNHAYFYHKIIRPRLSSLAHLKADEKDCEAIAKIIFAVFDKANNLLASSRDDFPFTPRHLHMIAVFLAQYFSRKEPIKINELHLAIAACFSIFGDSLPSDKKNKLLQFVSNQYEYDPRHFAQFQSDSINQIIRKHSIERTLPFAFTESRHGLLQVLDTLLSIRMEGQCHIGLQLEGEPAVGKTDVVKYYLTLLGIKFHELTFSSNYQTVRDALLRIFNAGEIVIINEFSSGGALHERLLNTLIMGKDELGNKADVPGFLAIATCNSMALAGRNELSPALQARLLFYSPPIYTTEELFEIFKLFQRLAVDYKLSPENTKILINQFIDALEYANKHKLTPKPNLRTLLDVAGVPTLRELPPSRPALNEEKEKVKEGKGKEKVKEEDDAEKEKEKEKEEKSGQVVIVPEDSEVDKPKQPESIDPPARQLNRVELIRKIEHKILMYIYSRFNIFLASPESKQHALQELLADILAAGEGADLRAVILAWQNKTHRYWHNGGEVTLSNKDLLKAHRNTFFSTTRPNVKTDGEIFLEQLLDEPTNRV